MTIYDHEALTRQIIGAAIEVHRGVGPGLLESAYRECLIDELSRAGLKVEREKNLSVTYKGRPVPNAFRADLIVNEAVLVELKAVAEVQPIHRAQTITYLKLSGLRVGLLLNFNSVRLKDGIHRFVV